MSEASPRTPSFAFWPAIVGIAAALGAINSGSFWIDEFWTEMFATAPTLRDCWLAMEQKRCPEIQAPLYIAYIWVWAHLFGSGEWIMRAAGAPWFVAGLLVFTNYAGRLMRSPLLLTMMAAFSPFVWYYLNEARVYSFQLGWAFAAVGAALEMGRIAAGNGGPNKTVQRIFIVALVGLCGSSVLGAVFGFMLFIGLLTVVPRRQWRQLWQTTPATFTVGAALLIGLAAYYAWTTTVRPRAAVVGTTTPQTVVYIFYELLGFVGLGPGRNTLRSSGASALKPYLPLLLLFAMLAATILFMGTREVLSRLGWRRAASLGAITLTPLLLLITIGVATHFRLLGRHVTPMLPPLLLLVTFGLERAWRTGMWHRGAVTLFCLLWLGSSFSIRWSERQRKDDYRQAAAIASDALQKNGVVWWAADAAGAKYYGLPVQNEGSSRFYRLMNADEERLRTLPPPAVIILSKPESYDAFGQITTYIKDHQYIPQEQPPAFVVYRRPPP
jgi:hypothetical protein